MILDRLSKQLEMYPETNLSLKKSKLGTRYYEINGSNQKYLGASRQDRIKQLEEKNYCDKLLSAVIKEKDALEKIIKKLEKVDDADTVFLNIPFEKRHLIEPYVFIKDEAIIKRFEKNPLNENRLITSPYVTLNGENVRSKSEVIIADRMEHYGVLYCYEPPTRMCEDFNEIWHPDYLCLNKRTGETYYWEHFGKLDDPKYLEGFHCRMERYAEAGILLGKNLIISTETIAHPLNTKYVDLLIKKYYDVRYICERKF